PGVDTAMAHAANLQNGCRVRLSSRARRSHIPASAPQLRFSTSRTAPMLRVRTSLPIMIAFILCAAVPAAAQMEPTTLRELDHDAYEIWNRIGAQALSND